MADNTLQFEWITDVKGNLDELFQDNPNVFVAGDLLWYPVHGSNTIRVAPDALVAFGRPKGYRGSYRQWVEGDIPPQVVFEIHSPCNTRGEMARKQRFYEEYGVEEYYYLDPESGRAHGWQREGSQLVPVAQMDGLTSPRLGIRFEVRDRRIVLYMPDGTPFRTRAELVREAALVSQRAEAERQRADRLAARLRALGIDPDSDEG